MGHRSKLVRHSEAEPAPIGVLGLYLVKLKQECQRSCTSNLAFRTVFPHGKIPLLLLLHLLTPRLSEALTQTPSSLLHSQNVHPGKVM